MNNFSNCYSNVSLQYLAIFVIHYRVGNDYPHLQAISLRSRAFLPNGHFSENVFPSTGMRRKLHENKEIQIIFLTQPS